MAAATKMLLVIWVMMRVSRKPRGLAHVGGGMPWVQGQMLGSGSRVYCCSSVPKSRRLGLHLIAGSHYSIDLRRAPQQL